jgi:hypothetical protein
METIIKLAVIPFSINRPRMSRVLLLFFVGGLTTSLMSFGQSTPCDSVYVIVDEMPKFGNSDRDLFIHIGKNLKFGKCGLDEMKLLTWTIDTEGRMINIDASSLEGKCKQDIIGQLEKFPSWKPGRLNGRPVCVKMNLRMCIKTG